MSINFPQNPSVNDQYTESGITYIWNGSYWGKFEVTNQALSGLVAKIDVESNFPASLDSGLADPISELQAKVGVDGSAVTSSLDYKLAQLTADAVVSDQINEIVQLSQAEYDALTPDANTLYVIVG